jgi:Arc/MetJ-type ribon-helix-helix transcriptional regulator
MTTNTKTMHISLPESLIDSAREQAEEGQYGNVSEYMRSLIRDSVRLRAEQKLAICVAYGIIKSMDDTHLLVFSSAAFTLELKSETAILTAPISTWFICTILSRNSFQKQRAIKTRRASSDQDTCDRKLSQPMSAFS